MAKEDGKALPRWKGGSRLIDPPRYNRRRAPSPRLRWKVSGEWSTYLDPPFLPPMRPIRPKNSSPWRFLVVRPPLRPASARDILPFEDWGMRTSSSESWLLVVATLRP